MGKKVFNDILYVSDGKVRRADIVVEDEYITQITDKEEIPQPSALSPHFFSPASLMITFTPGNRG